MNELVNADNLIKLMKVDYYLEKGYKLEVKVEGFDLEFFEQIQDKNKFLNNIDDAIKILKDFKNFYEDREIEIINNTIKIKNLVSNKKLEFELDFEEEF